MKKLKFSFFVLLILVAVIVVRAAFLPNQYQISREMEIQQSAEGLFSYINNTRKSDQWMPWIEMDPQMKMTYSGPEEGVGATSRWVSEGGMGTGQAKVIESIPNQKVRTEILYEKPMHMDQVSEITLTPSNSGTVVRWTVTGHNNLLQRIVCQFKDMDKMVGDMFLKGLNKLKTQAEAKG